MIVIDGNNKEECCGCTACANICPKKAITMVEDKEGFLYPKINKDKCINCGLCNRVCPVKNCNVSKNQSIVHSYVIQNKNSYILKNSTSGGFFTPISNYILKNNGTVIGVGYNEKLQIKHIIVSNHNKDDLRKITGSKYVQSNLENIFTNIKKILDKKTQVLFSGTPCQVEGLLNFLQKEYDNLITVDVICHGTPSQKIWNEYIKYQEKKYKSKISNFNFRNKTYGYHSGTMMLKFENGKKYYGSARTDFMLKSFFSEISSRPSCYSCSFKKEKHRSDFTIFDCWHASKLNESIKDDDRGYTNLFINTQKGCEIFNNIKDDFVYYESEYKKAIDFDGSMVKNSAIPHENRGEFYKYLNNHSLEETIKEFIPISKKDFIIEKIKLPLYKIGLTKIINRKKM